MIAFVTNEGEINYSLVFCAITVASCFSFLLGFSWDEKIIFKL